ncbi:MAG: PAS domain S-box protein [Acidobacteria bacterium]|nr:PAS domain S-box protein [Acidobacteriota bacterium]
MNGLPKQIRSQGEVTELLLRIQQLDLELTKTKEALQSETVERIRAQEQLSKSEEKFGTFLQSVSEGIVGTDESGRVVFVNARAEAMFGYDLMELIGQPVEILLPESLREIHARHRLEYVAEPHTRPLGTGLNLLGRRKDGTEFPVDVGLAFVKTDQGFVATSFIMDITKRKQAEAELFHREQEFKAMVENSPDIVARLDRDLRYVYVNPAIERTIGLSPQHCLGKTRAEAGLPENVWKPWDAHCREVFETGRETSLEFTFPAVNGIRSYRSRNVPEFGKDGSVESVLSITYDMADLKRAQETQFTLASIVESSNDAIISETLEGVIVSWNKAAERIYGYSAEEVVGQSISILKTSDRADEILQILEGVQRGETVEHYETVRQRKDGTQIDVSLTISPILDATGKITGASAISRDITEQKKAGEMARLQELRLLQADKMASLGVLVSGTAHEINNPNNYILLNSRIISKVWNDAKPILQQYYEQTGDFPLAGMPYSQAHEKIGQLVSGISEGALRIERIVRNLKDFARKDSGDLNQTVNVNAVIESGLVIVSSLIKKSTDFFSVEYSPDLPRIKGNAQQLGQVVINLVTNACQALPSKEKGIVVSTGLSKDAGNISIEVRDEGIGITPENLKFIFDPFFTTKRDTSGTGLGLSTSHSIVKNHGGELRFTSEPGKGTSVAVILPIAQNDKT